MFLKIFSDTPKVEIEHSPTCTDDGRKMMQVTCRLVRISRFLYSSIDLRCGDLDRKTASELNRS